ncbi:MAG: acyl-CoA dehydratase activase-related protein [Desulfitobacteriaceae bacterium]|nr:acyl-CoA dehydratase activase-related protein [Desulfitobacteriaceae bacterium]MDD4752523.1 acyl-CoA dehydratase activase-related protein [Desulfitobacteriaceae bacterium]
MNTKTVGIPQAMLYYYYHYLWKSFFERLGLEVKFSGETNKHILNAGISSAVDEACLPVKVFYGHVQELAEKVDFLFLPRVVSTEKKEYMCPKLLGLPDMIKASLAPQTVLIDVNINMRNKNSTMKNALGEVAEIIGVSHKKALAAWRWAEKKQEEYQSNLVLGNLPFGHENKNSAYQIALLGHGYNIFDNYINMNLIEKLQLMGADIKTKEMVSHELIEKHASSLPKKMFWTFGKQLLGSGLYYLNNPEIKGIIFLASFGCGPDSLVGELLERWAKRGGQKPFMIITIDEHTGEAGLVTRIEAFMDMIKRKVS